MTITGKTFYNIPMEMTFDRNRLGVGLAVSLVVHLVLLFFIAVISSIDIKPVVPESKDFFVEIFDGTVEKKEQSRSEENKRFGREANRVEKETAPPPSPLPPEVFSKEQRSVSSRPESVQAEPSEGNLELESSKEPFTDAPGLDVKEQAPVIQDGLSKSPLEKAEKKLPSFSALMPSYERLSMQRPDLDTPREVEIGNAVSLNTTEFKYISYFSKIKRQIQMVWKYPESARREGLKGILTLKFSINEDGTLKGVNLLRSSGSSILDGAAIDAIRDAVPFFPLPDNLGEVLDVVANFEYELNGYYFR